MKSKISIVLMVVFVVSLCALATLAQAKVKEQKSQLIWMREIAVKPPMVGECVEAMKYYMALGSITLGGQ
jgi:hypothetical protein